MAIIEKSRVDDSFLTPAEGSKPRLNITKIVFFLSFLIYSAIVSPIDSKYYFYTPGIYAEGYIVLSSVLMLICLFMLRSWNLRQSIHNCFSSGVCIINHLSENIHI